VNSHSPAYPRLHQEWPTDVVEPTSEELPHLEQLCRSFERATGWPLTYLSAGSASGNRDILWSADIDGDTGDPAGGRIAIEQRGKPVGGRESPHVGLRDAQQLAEVIGDLLGELHRTRRAVWQREAELATGVPVVSHSKEQAHLAARLEAVLKGGAEAVGCQAAALYLLDDATTQLKLRAAWGLPSHRLLEPARPLSGAIADLHALTGQAVAIEDTSLLPHWKVPERFASAACVPVASPTVELGTLWMFCDRTRDFTDKQTNLIEIIAGRLAADLEREILLGKGNSVKQFERQVLLASHRQQNQLPQVAPLVDGWKVAGWTAQADALGGDFHDWFILEDGSLAVALGDAQGQSLDAAMVATTLAATVKAHSRYTHDAAQMVMRANHTLWTAGVGDQFASLLYAIIKPDTGRMQFALAGGVGGVILRPNGWDTISRESLPLGEHPETQYRQFRQVVAAGDTLVLFSEGVRRAPDRQGRPLGDDNIAKALCKHLDWPAKRMVEAVRRLVDTRSAENWRDDCTVLVAQRCR